MFVDYRVVKPLTHTAGMVRGTPDNPHDELAHRRDMAGIHDNIYVHSHYIPTQYVFCIL